MNLFGMNLRQGGEALIGLAHPDVRDDPRRAFAETRYVALPG